MEYASFTLKEIKTEEGGSSMSFSGYGAVFNNIDSYGDVILPGAFADTLASARASGIWPSMLMQHGGWGTNAEDMMPIGIWTDMAEDGIGLKMEGVLADTQRGREAYSLLKMSPRPAITGLSIGYVAKSYEPRTKPEEPRRKLTKIDLFEVSLVTFPANPKARVSSVKSELTIRDAEKCLREGGFSREVAKGIVSVGYKNTMSLRDAGGDQTGVTEDLRRLINQLSQKGTDHVGIGRTEKDHR